MRRRIPSTGALIAFEAAGRHESFSRAAEELHLTEGAISRQIARLEAFLDMALFLRVKNRVFLTDSGRHYWEQVVAGLDKIERDTVNAQARPATGGVLELAVIPTFANEWIIPRLPKFHAEYPDITVNMSERPQPFLFADSPFDAAIHYDHPAWAGVVQQKLFSEELVPVCHPSLTGGRTGLQPADIRSLPLLHKRGQGIAWKRWWDDAGVSGLNAMTGTRYDMFSMVIKAACAGLGLALVPKLYVLNELAAGRLIIPCAHKVPAHKQYCIVYPEQKLDHWPLGIFLRWLEKEAILYVHQRDEEEATTVSRMPVGALRKALI